MELFLERVPGVVDWVKVGILHWCLHLKRGKRKHKYICWVKETQRFQELLVGLDAMWWSLGEVMAVCDVCCGGAGLDLEVWFYSYYT